MRRSTILVLCGSAILAVLAAGLFLFNRHNVQDAMVQVLQHRGYPSSSAQQDLAGIQLITVADSGTPSDSVGEHRDALEANLLKLLNEERVGCGLPPLLVDLKLVDLARERSTDMAKRDYFGHVTPEGTMVFDMMDRKGIPYRLAGENLARNNYPWDKSADVAHTGFMNSPAHKQNDLDPSFDRVGIGVAVTGSGSVYFTELFCDQD